MGTVRWVVVTRHTAEGQLDGTGTVRVDHPTLGFCQSTYNMAWTEL
jgi:hypothetical protein